VEKNIKSQLIGKAKRKSAFKFRSKLWSLFIILYIFFINVDFWVMNNRLNIAWDKKLNELMEQYSFRCGNTSARANLGDYVIWIENYPYAAFTCMEPPISGRPKRATILKAYKKLTMDQCNYDKP
jgi:hypothetical protein